MGFEFHCENRIKRSGMYGAFRTLKLTSCKVPSPSLRRFLLENRQSGQDPGHCGAEERGKTVYIAVCWQNEKSERSLGSDIESAIVVQCY